MSEGNLAARRRFVTHDMKTGRKLRVDE